ncbi:MAG TPA: HlyD family efflux transporter periplasmic adaptor subunit, partial [Thermoanaerobaculia bacterium]|nr:HlyD family efflux transporter periplasmic adaptor subunit [Thermoanaerobaculia bacterium]
MDRELDVSFRRRLMARRVGVGVAGVALVVAVLLFLPGWLRPSVDRDRIRTARVERGPVEATVQASGTVIPAFESVLSSPVEARVQKVLKRPGERVAIGEEILVLDTSASRLDLERLEDRLEQKANEQEQIRIGLDKSLSDLRGQIESQKLDTEVAEARAAQNRKLHAEGLVSEETLRVVEVEAKKARIQLRQLEEQVASERRSAESRVQGLNLDLAILRKERDEAGRQLELATTRADRAGVITWVFNQEGGTVRRGDVIARIADPESFRIEATVSDVHSSRLAPGQPVKVVMDGQSLPGRLATIYPSVENGSVKFNVDLDDPRNPKLRQNLRVDVLVV